MELRTHARMARRYRSYLLTRKRSEYLISVVLSGEYGRTVPVQAKTKQRLADAGNSAFGK